MAAPSVSLLYASVLAHTVVNPWNLVELALQLALMLPQVILFQEEMGSGVLVSLPGHQELVTGSSRART